MEERASSPRLISEYPPYRRTMKYPKIQTLWKRDSSNKNIIIPGTLSKEEFRTIRYWHLTKKYHGTNIRIIFTDDGITYHGKTDDAQISTKLLQHLQKVFTVDSMRAVFPGAKEVVLFGEGYGGNINDYGKKYRPDEALILFDAVVDGWWLTPDNVQDVAKKLGIPSVEHIGVVDSVEEVENIVKKMVETQITDYCEGAVARAHPMVMFRDNKDHIPIMFKLKVKDYENYGKFKVE